MTSSPRVTEQFAPAAPLGAGRNFRDIGGYAGFDLRPVRRGIVFRSAALTPADDRVLEDMGVRMVVDLRSTRERSAHPSVALIESRHRDYDNSDADLVSALRSSTASAASIKGIMTATYRSLLDEQAESLAELVRLIARGNVPIVFHCTAGKDRTGMAAALLLALVGVDRNDIARDYLRTREDNERATSNIRSALKGFGIAEIDEAVLTAMMDVDVAYLDAMFDELERRFGDVETFAFRRLGLTAADLASLRALMLEEEDEVHDDAP